MSATSSNKLWIAVVHTKVINCKSVSKSCLLQVVNTKAIAALTQFCDFWTIIQTLWKPKLALNSTSTQLNPNSNHLNLKSTSTKFQLNLKFNTTSLQPQAQINLSPNLNLKYEANLVSIIHFADFGKCSRFCNLLRN